VDEHIFPAVFSVGNYNLQVSEDSLRRKLEKIVREEELEEQQRVQAKDKP
jgi:hypothetical protein